MKSNRPHPLALPALAGLAVLALTPCLLAVPGTITTVAGTGSAGASGNGGFATAAKTQDPRNVVLDTAGNWYLSDGNSWIRRIDAATGGINRYAGFAGISGFEGDGGPARDATFKSTAGMALDAEGNLYVADFGSNRVRKIDARTGIITTVAGTGSGTFNGDDIPATSANLWAPTDVEVDREGNLFIADMGNRRVRRVDTRTGIITTVAGNGTGGDGGDGGPATEAPLSQMRGIALDSKGNLFIADTENHRIRRVDAETGRITTHTGTGTPGYNSDNIVSRSAHVNYPYDVAFDAADNLYIADYENHRIRRVYSGTGQIQTVAGIGSGTYSGDGGPATTARIYYPRGVAVAANGDLYICDTVNQRVRKVEALAPASTFQPDNRIGRKFSQQRGDDIYNDTGVGQKQGIRGRHGRKIRFCFSVENDTDGTYPDSFTLAATRKDRQFKPRYVLVGEGNVTAGITAGMLDTPGVAPGQSARLKAIVSPNRRARGSMRKVYRITSGSHHDGDAGDAACAILKVR